MTSNSETIFLSRDGEPRPLASGTTDITYSYDDKLNPFYGVFIIPAPGEFVDSPCGGPNTLYGGFTNRFNFSQNNLLSAQSSNGTSTSATPYAYTYNTANLPTSRTTTTGGNVVETLRYEYEPY